MALTDQQIQEITEKSIGIVLGIWTKRLKAEGIQILPPNGPEQIAISMMAGKVFDELVRSAIKNKCTK